jgi:hypothetical protein
METWIGETTPSDRRRSRWTFKASWNDTLNLLDRELDNLGAREFVIEADFKESDIRLDGVPRANARQPQFPGVRIYFESMHGPLVYQADNCAFWQHNVRSIALGLEALRAVDRYGITHRAEQYTGFRALGAGPSARPEPTFVTVDEAVHWLRQQTGIAGSDGLTLRSLMRMVARNVHPDSGGSRADWDKYEQAVKTIKQGGLL